MDWGLLRLHRALRDAGKTPLPRPVSPMSGTQLPKHRLSFSPAAALGSTRGQCVTAQPKEKALECGLSSPSTPAPAASSAHTSHPPIFNSKIIERQTINQIMSLKMVFY